MILLVGLLIFTAVSTAAGLALCQLFGVLSGWIAWVSLAVGALAGIYSSYASRTAFSEKIKTDLFDKIMFLFFSLFCLRHFLWIFFIRDGMVCTLNHRHNYSDLPLHLTYINNFVQGMRFWPEDPIFSGAKLTYHFGIDLFTALFVKLGVPLTNILPQTGLVLGFLTMFSLFLWGRGFSLAGFLFSGGIAGYLVFSTGIFDDYQADLAWKSIPLTLLVPQRSFLFGFPAGLLLLWSWRQRFLRDGRGLPVFIEGILWGLMPLFHVPTFIFLVLVFVIWTIATRKMKEALPVYYWAVIPATYLILQLSNRFEFLSSHFRIVPGWEMGSENPLFFFLINFGFFPLLVLVSLYGAFRARDRESLLILVPAVALFSLFMVVMILPSSWDNIKILAWCYLLMLPAVDRYAISCCQGPLRLTLLIVLFLSGFVCVLSSMGAANRGATLISLKELDGVCHALKKVPQSDRVATVQDFKHPVLLCGRQVSLGWNGHIWSHGYSPREREANLKRLMDGEFNWKDVAAYLEAKYLFWGPGEEKAYPNSNRPWEAVSLKIAEGPWGKLYDLRKPSPLASKLPEDSLQPGQGLRILFYDNERWEGSVVKTSDVSGLNFAWHETQRPMPGPFSLVAEGEVDVPEDGEVTFCLASDDGSALEIEGEEILDNLGVHAVRVRCAARKLSAGWHRLRVRYFDVGGGAHLQLWWRFASGKEEWIPPQSLRPRASR